MFEPNTRRPSWVPPLCVTLLLSIPALVLLIMLVAAVAFNRGALIALAGIFIVLLAGSPVVGLTLIVTLKRRDRNADVFWPGFLLFLTAYSTHPDQSFQPIVITRSVSS